MKWKALDSEEIFKAGFFRLRKDRCEMPDGRIMPRYYVMEFPDWVNVFPVTEEGEVLLVKQYRHASGQIHLELPGGSSEPGSSESVEEAALRELVEETGYSSQELIRVGTHYPNPAMQNNRMHSFIALNCKKTQEPQFDPYEELELYPRSIEQVRTHLAQGDIDHTIMVASIQQALNYLDQNSKY